MKKLLYFLLAIAMLATCGCTGDSNGFTSAIGIPNPVNLKPTGIIQGQVFDKCTNRPLQGAIVDIGIAKTTTNAQGMYVFRNIPATSYVGPTTITEWVSAGNLDKAAVEQSPNIDFEIVESFSSMTGTYSVSIDLRKAKATGGTGTESYPDFVRGQAEVIFSSFEETKTHSPELYALITATNHDTPITNLAAGAQDFSIGQTNSGINGIAILSGGVTPVPNGYTVRLYSDPNRWRNSSLPDTAVGAHGNLVATTTVAGGAGRFAFSGLEAGQRFEVEVVDVATGVVTMSGWDHVSTDCTGLVKYLGLSDAVVVESIDELAPFITAISPAYNYQDLPVPADGIINVSFTFSEPIAATPHNTGQGLTPSDLVGLYNDIYVNYEGSKLTFNKAGNIPHVISWNSDMTVLTVQISGIQAGSVYSVGIVSDTSNLNGLVDGFNENYFSGVLRYFTTYGAAASAQPQNLVVRNPETIDFDSTFTLSWEAALGAKSYNVYCQQVQWNDVTGNVHPYFLLTNTTNTAFNVDPDNYTQWSNTDWTESDEFVEERKIKLSYNCYVAGVDLDGLEGQASDPVHVEDAVDPHLTNNITYQTTLPATFNVYFTEWMDKATVENEAFWTLNAAAFTGTAPTIVSVEYIMNGFSPSNAYARVTLSGPGTLIATLDTAILTATTSITDVAGNGMGTPNTITINP